MINIDKAKKAVQVIEHINPPWGEDGTRFSANFQGIIGRGKSEEEAVSHLLYLANQNSELMEGLENVIAKAGR